MTYMAAGASNRNIKNVMSIDYLVTPNDVVATVNQTQLVGRYPNISAAELAVRGILVKCGVKLLDQTLLRIPTTITSSLSDQTSTVNFANFTFTVTNLLPITVSGTEFRFNDTNSPIVLSVTDITNQSNVNWFIKESIVTIPTNPNINPVVDDYVQINQNSNIVVDVNNFVRLKAVWKGPLLNFVNTRG
ncbi:MAG: hypothetical protein ACK528_15255, partial [Alphaproteobacteria bacterium]